MYPCMKLRHLEELLQGIEKFEKPKVLFEQYVTPSHLSCHMLHTIQERYDDIDSKFIADLGSGCGGLSIGVAAMKAAYVLGFEIDDDALEIFNQNIYDFELSNIGAIQCDVTKTIPHR